MKQIVSRVEPSISFWAYFAGFFDGEGHLELPFERYTSPHLRINQSGDEGKRVLSYFVDVLKNQCGLPGRMWVRLASKSPNNFVNPPKKLRPMWELQISKRESVEFILRRIVPYLWVKRTKASDVLRYCKIFPMRSCWMTRQRAVNCRKGHLFTPENTYTYRRGRNGRLQRNCRICQRAKDRARREAKRGAVTLGIIN